MQVKSLSRIRLVATPWTAAYQAPPSMGSSRQEYWSGLTLPFLDQGLGLCKSDILAHQSEICGAGSQEGRRHVQWGRKRTSWNFVKWTEIHARACCLWNWQCGHPEEAKALCHELELKLREGPGETGTQSLLHTNWSESSYQEQHIRAPNWFLLHSHLPSLPQDSPYYNRKISEGNSRKQFDLVK